MITVGVDLAAEAGKTAVAVVEWTNGRAVVGNVQVGVDDAGIVAMSREATKIGIDCPFGWPIAFVDFVTRHRNGDVDLRADTVRARKPLVYRATDRYCQDKYGLRPLSVSADLIGHVALRCAGLLTALAAAGHDVDRSGGGAIAETYPAGSLELWGLTHRRYKGSVNRPALNESVDALLAAATWLSLAQFDELCRRHDDAFDAVIAALTACAAATDRTEHVPDEYLAIARTEGWIALPSCSLEHLADVP